MAKPEIQIFILSTFIRIRMIIKWISVWPVIAQVTRNIRGVDADFMVDLPEWIAEGIMHLKTHYQLELCYENVDVKFHMAAMPCHAEALAAVTSGGQRLMIADEVGPMQSGQSSLNGLFTATFKYPGGVTKLDDVDINNMPFYTSTVSALENMSVNGTQFYRPRYNKIETSIETGVLGIYFWKVPQDVNGLPMVPDNADYRTALYWYCRMMMIGAGYADKVFSYDYCDEKWEKHAGRALGQITYPTIDEKKRNIINNTGLIPHQYDWETFGGGGPEMTFNDDL
jgi:hypothetical protein